MIVTKYLSCIIIINKRHQNQIQKHINTKLFNFSFKKSSTSKHKCKIAQISVVERGINYEI